MFYESWRKQSIASVLKLSRQHVIRLPRIINQHGLVSVQRFYIYAERSLAKKRVAVWNYEGRLHIEY